MRDPEAARRAVIDLGVGLLGKLDDALSVVEKAVRAVVSSCIFFAVKPHSLFYLRKFAGLGVSLPLLVLLNLLFKLRILTLKLQQSLLQRKRLILKIFIKEKARKGLFREVH